MADTVVKFETKFGIVNASARYSNSNCGLVEISNLQCPYREQDRIFKNLTAVYKEIIEIIKFGKFTTVDPVWGEDHFHKAQVMLSDYKYRDASAYGEHPNLCIEGLLKVAVAMKREDRSSLKMVVSPYTYNPNSGNRIRVAVIRTDAYANVNGYAVKGRIYK